MVRMGKETGGRASQGLVAPGWRRGLPRRQLLLLPREVCWCREPLATPGPPSNTLGQGATRQWPAHDSNLIGTSLRNYHPLPTALAPPRSNWCAMQCASLTHSTTPAGEWGPARSCWMAGGMDLESSNPKLRRCLRVPAHTSCRRPHPSSSQAWQGARPASRRGPSPGPVHRPLLPVSLGRYAPCRVEKWRWHTRSPVRMEGLTQPLSRVPPNRLHPHRPCRPAPPHSWTVTWPVS